MSNFAEEVVAQYGKSILIHFRDYKIPRDVSKVCNRASQNAPYTVLGPGSGLLSPNPLPFTHTSIVSQASQAYTIEFGSAIARLFSENRKAWRRRPVPKPACGCASGCPDIQSLLAASHGNEWADADLVASAQYLAARASLPAVIDID